MSWRPHNESAEDIAREQAAANTLSDLWNADVLKLSDTLYGLDWVFSRDNEVCAFGEFKYRTKKYDTLLLGLGKVMKMQQVHEMTGLPVLLVISWPDGLWYWEYNKDDIHKVQVGGNFRGQNGDTEPVVHIPVDRFIRVKNG